MKEALKIFIYIIGYVLIIIVLLMFYAIVILQHHFLDTLLAFTGFLMLIGLNVIIGTALSMRWYRNFSYLEKRKNAIFYSFFSLALLCILADYSIIFHDWYTNICLYLRNYF